MTSSMSFSRYFDGAHSHTRAILIHLFIKTAINIFPLPPLLKWMVPVFRFFEYVNFERKEQKINPTSKQNLRMTRLQNLFSSKNGNYFLTNCYHGNDTWWFFRPTSELRTLISWKLTWWPPIFFTLVSLSFENETTGSFNKISRKQILYNGS